MFKSIFDVSDLMAEELYFRQPHLWRLYQSTQACGEHCYARIVYLTRS